jgi:hypothetical protein
MRVPAQFLAQNVCHAADRSLQVCEQIAQAVGFILGEVEGMSLPIEFDAIPIIAPADLFHVLKTTLSDLRHGHVPGQREPFSRAVAQQPLRMLVPNGLYTMGFVKCVQVSDLRPTEVVVIHAHRGIHM